MGEEGGGGSDDFDPHGDPNTDPKERRRIRYEYRELIAETQSKDQKMHIDFMLLCFQFFLLAYCHIRSKNLTNLATIEVSCERCQVAEAHEAFVHS